MQEHYSFISPEGSLAQSIITGLITVFKKSVNSGPLMAIWHDKGTPAEMMAQLSNQPGLLLMFHE